MLSIDSRAFRRDIGGLHTSEMSQLVSTHPGWKPSPSSSFPRPGSQKVHLHISHPWQLHGTSAPSKRPTAAKKKSYFCLTQRSFEQCGERLRVMHEANLLLFSAKPPHFRIQPPDLPGELMSAFLLFFFPWLTVLYHTLPQS